MSKGETCPFRNMCVMQQVYEAVFPSLVTEKLEFLLPPPQTLSLLLVNLLYYTLAMLLSSQPLSYYSQQLLLYLLLDQHASFQIPPVFFQLFHFSSFLSFALLILLIIK